LPNISDHPVYLRIKNQPSPTTIQTMTSAIRTKAYNLPELLSTLPRDGISALVRPSTSPNSVYRVTRSKLKFRARSEIGEQATKDEGRGDDMLAVSGKIWGMRFVNGTSSLTRRGDDEDWEMLTFRTLCRTYQIGHTIKYRRSDKRKNRSSMDTGQRGGIR